MFDGMDSPGAGSGRLVVGIGNDFRGDDAAGLMAARRLAELDLPNIRIVESIGNSASLLDLWKGKEQVIIIDAVSSGEESGKIHRFEPISQPIPDGLFSTSSTHDFGLLQAIELSRALNYFPGQLIVYGIVGSSFMPGTAISNNVINAIEIVVSSSLEDLSLRPVKQSDNK